MYKLLYNNKFLICIVILFFVYMIFRSSSKKDSKTSPDASDAVPSNDTTGGGKRKGGSLVRLRAQKAAKPPPVLEDFPLGFTTGDNDLARAATVLRLLYVADLREFQTEINTLVAQIQELTAEPKTDSRLGKVGF